MVVANQFCSFDASDTSAAYKKIIELWGAAGPEEWFATFLDETEVDSLLTKLSIAELDEFLQACETADVATVDRCALFKTVLKGMACGDGDGTKSRISFWFQNKCCRKKCWF